MQQYLSNLERHGSFVPLNHALSPLICKILLFGVSRENQETVKTLKSHPPSSREAAAEDNTHAMVSPLLPLCRPGHYANIPYITGIPSLECIHTPCPTRLWGHGVGRKGQSLPFPSKSSAEEVGG